MQRHRDAHPGGGPPDISFVISSFDSDHAPAPSRRRPSWWLRVAGICAVIRSVLVLSALHWQLVHVTPTAAVLGACFICYLLLGVNLTLGARRALPILAISALALSDLATTFLNPVPWQAALSTLPSLVVVSAAGVAWLRRPRQHASRI